MKGFKCTKCSSIRLEEFVTNCTISSEVLSFDEDFITEYGNLEIHWGTGMEKTSYQCHHCGHVLPVGNTEELFKWIEENC